ncbi:hypothetical protein QBC44DRAFT_163161 [Cladorrhinum sp. PSN332]|nr:hypothetical protein QBC44DRAFT_163161 [Cladorrhinum sp. PSN332]
MLAFMFHAWRGLLCLSVFGGIYPCGKECCVGVVSKVCNIVCLLFFFVLLFSSPYHEK